MKKIFVILASMGSILSADECCISFPEQTPQNGQYKKAAVKVTEYTVIDLEHQHTHGLAGGSLLQQQPADRYLNNPVWNMVQNILGKDIDKEALLFIPSQFVQLHDCDTCGYFDPVVPQYFTSSWLRKTEMHIGQAQNLAHGAPVSGVQFTDMTDNPQYQQINHHLVHAIVSFPEYFTSTPQERNAYYDQLVMETYPGVPSDDPNCEGNVCDQECQDLRTEMRNTMEQIFSSLLPAFPKGSIPPKRRIVTCAGAVNSYPRMLVPYDQTASIFVGAGREFSVIEFPYGYAGQLGGGDLAPIGWHFVNPIQKPFDLPEGAQVVIKSEFSVDFDFKALYNALLTALGEQYAGWLQLKFAEFGFDPTQGAEIEYKNLQSTWVGTADCTIEEFPIQPGKSKSRGRDTFLGARGQIAYVLPHFHDHTKHIKLYVECAGEKTLLRQFTPNLAKDEAAHDGLPRFGDYGPLNDPIQLHLHDKPSHLPNKALQKAIWSPGANGPIIEDPVSTILRTRGKFDNLHDQMIDNMAISIVFWHALDGDCTIPSTPENPAMCEAHAGDGGHDHPG